MDAQQWLEKAEAIIAKVTELRKLQKAFFMGDKSVLGECKRLEKEIDKMIAEYNSPQTTLF